MSLMENIKEILVISAATFVIVLVFLIVFYFLGGGRHVNYSKAVINGHVFQIDVASTPAARTAGLSGRASLAEDGGMLFVFDKPGDYGFWMQGMKFPLDIIWIKDNVVIDIEENVPPESGVLGLKIYHPSQSIDKVLEINAGLAEKYGVKIGDRISFEKEASGKSPSR